MSKSVKFFNFFSVKKIPPVIHIAGTNGKGSTLAFIKAGLEASGKTVHSYTSPHLCRINERIKLKKIKKNSIIFVPFTKNFNWESNLEIDLVFNSNSFSELDNKILTYYLKLINTKIIPKFILHQNSNILLYPNSKRHIEILASKFKINKKKFRKVSSGLSLFQGGSGRYREYLYVRNDIL